MEENVIAPYFDGSQPCAQIGGDFFFPESPAELHANMRFIKPLCGSCEFKQECLEYAISHDVIGIWAATTSKDRKALRKRLNIQVKRYADYRSSMPL